MHEANLYNIFLSRLNKAELEYMVTGSVACVIYGQPRMTHDIDLVLNIGIPQIEGLVKLFPLTEFYCPPADVIQAESRRETRGHFNLIHHESGFKADVYHAGNEELIRWGLTRKKKFQMSDQVIWVAPPEYVILQKLQYYREGGSPKHLTDIQGILDASCETIDFQQLQIWMTKKNLQAEWDVIKRP